MITTCTGCQQKYRLETSKVPERLINVRCPQCKTVFLLDGTTRESTMVDPVASPPPAAEAESFAGVGTGSAVAAAPVRETATAVKVEAPREEPEVAETQPKRRKRRDKTEMLARALVSDILVYNQGVRDQALKEDNLLEALGPEIKKSWELYKEKVTPEVANSTNYFREALNDILADGNKVF